MADVLDLGSHRRFGSYLEAHRWRLASGSPDHGAATPVPEGAAAIDDELRAELDRLRNEHGSYRDGSG